MCVCIYCLVTKSCLTLDPMDGSLPGSSVHGISQARILEWVAISFSRAFQPRGQTCVSFIGRGILYHWATRGACVCLCTYIHTQTHTTYVYGNASMFFWHPMCGFTYCSCMTHVIDLRDQVCLLHSFKPDLAHIILSTSCWVLRRTSVLRDHSGVAQESTLPPSPPPSVFPLLLTLHPHLKYLVPC